MKQFALRTLPFVAAVALALYLVPWVLTLAHYKDRQAMIYDQAMQMAASDNPEEAAQAPAAFMQSIKVFKATQKQKGWLERYLLPQADQELAALAYFHVGNILRMQNKPKDALGMYVESLRLNAGQRMLIGVSARDDGMHQYGRDFCTALTDKVAQARPVSGDDCQLARLEKEADDTRNNLLALLSEHPELAPLLANPGDLPGQPSPGSPSDGQGKDVIPGDSGKQQSNGDNDAI